MKARRLLPLVVMLVLAVAVLSSTAEPPETGRIWFGLWRTRWIAVAGVLGVIGIVTTLTLFNSVWLPRGCLVAGSLAMVLGFLEVAGRIGVIDVARVFGAQDDDALGTFPAPNADIRGETYMDTATGWGLPHAPIPFHYVTNDLGYRNPSERTEGRIYTLGDSILVSALTSFERSLPGLLERKTGAPVVNLALIGIGPQREIALLRSSELPLDGRLVLHFLFEGNDLQDSRGYRAGPNDADAAAERDSFVEALLVSAQRLTQPVDAIAPRRTCTISGQTYTFFWTAEGYEDDAPEHDAIMAEIRAVAEEVSAAGGRYVLVYVPSKLRILGPWCSWPEDTDIQTLSDWVSPWRARVREDAEAAGVPLLDLTEALLASMRKGKVPWFWGDTHPDEHGHEVMADQLSVWIAPWL